MNIRKYLSSIFENSIQVIKSYAIFVLSLLLVSPIVLPYAECADTITIACIGDSNTDGWPDMLDEKPYTSMLQEQLGSEFKVLNFGKTNTTLLKKASDSYWDCPQFDSAMESKPDIVTIILGTNDCKADEWRVGRGAENFQKDYEDMIDTLSSLPTKPQVIACTPAPVRKNNNYEMVDSTMQNEIVPTIKKAADSRKVKLIDFNSVANDSIYFHEDGVHLDSTGHSFFADILKDSIQAYIELWGCTDTSAANYDPEAIKDDGSCTTKVQITLPVPNISSYNVSSRPKTMRIYSPNGTLLLQKTVVDADFREIRHFAASVLSQHRNVAIAIVQVDLHSASSPIFFRICTVK